MRDPGEYESFIISKAITIDGGGPGIATIVPSLSAAIDINAQSSEIVVLRNLSINGSKRQSATYGVTVRGGRAVIIDHCQISGFLWYGTAQVM